MGRLKLGNVTLSRTAHESLHLDHTMLSNSNMNADTKLCTRHLYMDHLPSRHTFSDSVFIYSVFVIF